MKRLTKKGRYNLSGGNENTIKNGRKKARFDQILDIEEEKKEVHNRRAQSTSNVNEHAP